MFKSANRQPSNRVGSHSPLRLPNNQQSGRLISTAVSPSLPSSSSSLSSSHLSQPLPLSSTLSHSTTHLHHRPAIQQQQSRQQHHHQHHQHHQQRHQHNYASDNFNTNDEERSTYRDHRHSDHHNTHLGHNASATRITPRHLTRQPLSYRHLYHAGNAGDVLKHSIITLLASQHIRMIPNGRIFIDTHAGPGGSYELSHEYARKKEEHRRAVSRIHDIARLAALNPQITSYTSLREGKIEFDDAFYRDALYLRLFSPSSDLYHRVPNHDGYGSPGAVNVFSDSKNDRIADVAVPIRTRPHDILITPESFLSEHDNPSRGKGVKNDPYTTFTDKGSGHLRSQYVTPDGKEYEGLAPHHPLQQQIQQEIHRMNRIIKKLDDQIASLETPSAGSYDVPNPVPTMIDTVSRVEDITIDPELPKRGVLMATLRKPSSFGASLATDSSSSTSPFPPFSESITATNNYNAVVLSHFIRHLLPIPMSVLPYLAILNHANKPPAIDSLTTKPTYTDILVGDKISKDKADALKRRQQRDIFDGIFSSSTRLTKDEKVRLIRQVVDGSLVSDYIDLNTTIPDNSAIVTRSMIPHVKSSTAGVIIDESTVYPLIRRTSALSILNAKDPNKVKKEVKKRHERSRHIISKKGRKVDLPNRGTISSHTRRFSSKQQQKSTSSGGGGGQRNRRGMGRSRRSKANSKESLRALRIRQPPAVEPVGLRDPNQEPTHQRHLEGDDEGGAAATEQENDDENAVLELHSVKYDLDGIQLSKKAPVVPFFSPRVYSEEYDFLTNIGSEQQQALHEELKTTLSLEDYCEKLSYSIDLSKKTIRSLARSLMLYTSQRFSIDIHQPLSRSPSSPWIFNSLLQQNIDGSPFGVDGPHGQPRLAVHKGRQPLPLENDLAIFSELHSTEYQNLQTNCSSTFMTKLQLKTLEDRQKELEKEEADIVTTPLKVSKREQNDSSDNKMKNDDTTNNNNSIHTSGSDSDDTILPQFDTDGHPIFPPTIIKVPQRSSTLGDAVSRMVATTILENTMSNGKIFSQWNHDYFETNSLKSLEESRAHNIYIDDHFQRFAVQYNGFQTAQIVMKQIQYYLDFISRLPYSVTHTTEALQRVKQTHTEQYEAFIARYYKDKLEQYQKQLETQDSGDGSTIVKPSLKAIRDAITEPQFFSASLTLCDPAYEVGDEYVSALDLLRTTLEYNSRGNMHTLAIWYPIIEKAAAAAATDASDKHPADDGNESDDSDSSSHQHKSSLNMSRISAPDLNRGHFITSLTKEFHETPKHLHRGLFLQVSRFLIDSYRQEAHKFKEEQDFNQQLLLRSLASMSKRGGSQNGDSDNDGNQSDHGNDSDSDSPHQDKWSYEHVYGKHNIDAAVAEIYTGASEKHKQERNRLSMVGNGMLIVSPLLTQELDESLSELLPWMSTALHRHGPERVHHTVMALDRGLSPNPDKPIADYTLHWM